MYHVPKRPVTHTHTSRYDYLRPWDHSSFPYIVSNCCQQPSILGEDPQALAGRPTDQFYSPQVVNVAAKPPGDEDGYEMSLIIISKLCGGRQQVQQVSLVASISTCT